MKDFIYANYLIINVYLFVSIVLPISSPTTMEVTNCFDIMEAEGFNRAPGGPKAQHL